MGAFKPLLPFGPKTIIETGIENMRRSGVETVVVVIGTGPRAEELRILLERSGVSIAVNPDPASEMGASIACGVRALPDKTKAVLINPVDHAAVPANVIALVTQEWLQGALLVKPTHNERGGHPVLIDLQFRDDLLGLDANAGLKGFLTDHEEQVRRIAVNSNYIARDMDSWDDYVALHREVFGIAPELPRGGVEHQG